SGCTFTLRPNTAHTYTHAVNIKHRRRIDTAYANVLGFLIGVLNSLNRIRRDPHPPACSTQALNCLGIFVRHVFTTIELDEVFARLDDLRVLRNRKDSGPLRRERLRHCLVQALDNRNHGDHCSDTYDDADQRQRRAQLVSAQTGGGDTKRLPDGGETKHCQESISATKSTKSTKEEVLFICFLLCILCLLAAI